MKKVIEILTAVSKATGVTISDMKSKNRAAYACQARYMAFYLLHRQGLVLQRIAEVFNRKDHSTVIHGMVHHEDLLETNSNYKYQFESIIVIPIEKSNPFYRHPKDPCMFKIVTSVFPSPL